MKKTIRNGRVYCSISMSPELYQKFREWKESKEIHTDNQAFIIMIQKIVGEWYSIDYDKILPPKGHFKTNPETAEVASETASRKILKAEYYNIAKSFLEYQKNQFPKLVKEVTEHQIIRSADTIRLLVERDNYPLEEIRKCLTWGRKDEFWSDKILSLQSIRKRSKNGERKFDNLYRSFCSKDTAKRVGVYKEEGKKYDW